MVKIIFLDIDGVLNTERYHKSLLNRGLKTSDKYGALYDPQTVVCLRKVITETGAKIVISSSWKFKGKSFLIHLWQERNLPGEIIDTTPSAPTDEWLLSANLDLLNELEVQHPKGLEIESWLKAHASKKLKYVIIDDEYVPTRNQENFFVQTDPRVGLEEKNVLQIIDILNAKI